jgi:hypothetical protein
VTRWLGICATLITIGVISLVLHWGTSGAAGTPAFELAVLILSITTPLASLMLTWHLWRDGHRGGALLSGSPLVLMVVVTALALLGAAPSLTLLLWLDLYVLLVFIIVLGWLGRQILAVSSPSSQDASRLRGRPEA